MIRRRLVATILFAAAATSVGVAQAVDVRLARALFVDKEPRGALANLGEVITPQERERLLTMLDGLARERSSAAPAVADAAAAAAPLADASWAEGYLKARRDAPLAPFLHTFVMARLRHAFELQAQANDVAGQTATARKYRAFLQRARAIPDPLIVRIADELDALPFLVRETAFHPREFNPDT
jgi:hypothetical protein